MRGKMQRVGTSQQDGVASPLMFLEETVTGVRPHWMARDALHVSG